MLVFVIPVKHPARSRNYRIVTDLLRQTLRSVEGQTDPHFATVIVCNQTPDWAEDAPNRVWVEVDFPPADPPATAKDWVDWLYMDKGAKIAVGLLHARHRFQPTHVMFVDADDFVSNRLAAFVREHPAAPGWYMPDGLIYSGLFKIAAPRDKFWSYCGTTHIIRNDLLPVPPGLGLRPSRDEVSAALDPFYLKRILGCHVDFIKYFEERGHHLEPLPFIGGIWHADTGENSSRAWWNGSRFGPIWGQPLPAGTLTEFGIPPAQRTAAETALLHLWRARSVVARAVKRVLGKAG